MQLLIILGDQLFPVEHFSFYEGTHVFMKEDMGLCTHYKYHKHKIIFFLASMRRFASAMKKEGFSVTYKHIEDGSYVDSLAECVKKKKVTKILVPEIQDKFFQKTIEDFCIDHDLKLEFIESPMFLTSRAIFTQYLKTHKKPFMKTFYESERKRQGIMVDGVEPWGGDWSYDEENRKKAPKILNIAPRPEYSMPNEVKDVKVLVDKLFADHPGETEDFWIPTDHADSQKALTHFLEHNFENFGPYQDAITTRDKFMFHAMLSPMINNGMLTPKNVIDRAVEHYEANMESIPLSSLEGFVRQIMGWREFVRGIYQNFSEKEEKLNFFKHERKMSKVWYTGQTGIPPVDDAIKKAQTYGYCHHIERLMVLSNFMLLCELEPKEVHQWFMEMFVDSADWVMGPNVYGMGQFSDGGIFATKPYISGSNYVLKMSEYKKGDWTDIWDGLFWRFIDKNRDFMKKQYRLSFMVATLDKMEKSKREQHFKNAENYLKKISAQK